MKRTWLLLALLLCPLVAEARQRVAGYCERGGLSAVTQALSSSTKVQTSYPSCHIAVYYAGTATLVPNANVYSDMIGTIKGNPFTAASDGYWYFYVDRSVDVQMYGGGIPIAFTRGDYYVMPFFDALDFPGATPALKITAALIAAGTNGTVLAPLGLGAGSPTTAGPAGSVVWDFRGGAVILQQDGRAYQAVQPGFVTPVLPRTLGLISGGNYWAGTSTDNQHTPDLYISRTSTSLNSVANCDAFTFLAPCDAPIMRIDGQNREAGNIVDMMGIVVSLSNFASNDNTGPTNTPYVAAYGAHLSDQATPNVTNMRDGNFALTTFGIPTTLGSGGQTRSSVGLEIDINNASIDGVYNGTIGNYTSGLTVVAAGNFSGTQGIGVGSSAVAGKGWLTGLSISGVVDCGLCVHVGGTGATLSPVYGVGVQTASTVGVLVGSGTLHAPTHSAYAYGNPTTGIMLDATGVLGAAAARASNTLRFTSTDATPTPHYWDMQADATQNLIFQYAGATKATIGNAGLLNAIGGFTTVAQVTSSVATGTAPLVIASTTPVSNLAATPTTYNAAGTQQTNTHIVRDTCTLGTSCAITLTGAAVFTNNTSYDCWPRDNTTPANAVTVTRTSGSALAFTGTGVDVINYFCLGN